MRSPTVRLVSALCLLWSITGVGTAAGQAVDPPWPRPNIILIMADDLGYGSLGCYGSTEVRTPNIDRLAAGGMRFTDFHSNGPMCTPTRAALMTGRYPQRCAWVDDAELSPVFREQRRLNPKQRWAWGLALSEVTLAEVLQQSGYRTALIGKWHLGYDFRFHPMNHGFDEFRGFVGGGIDYHTHVATSGLKAHDWWKGKQIERESGYATDLLSGHAADFIARHKDQPFFLYLAHAAPHDPWQGRDPHQKRRPPEIYREMIEILDESVGHVLDTMQKCGLERNTLVIFCSDNGAAAPRGFPANGRLQGNKGDVLEGGHRVPLIVSWPGVIAPGATNTKSVMTMDLFPTLANLARARLPAGHAIDGADLTPLLTGSTAWAQRSLHWLFADVWAVRKGAWKLTGTGDDTVALVNVEEDMGEQHNHLHQQPELVAELSKLHRDWVASVGTR